MARPLPSLRAGVFVSEQAMPKVPWHLLQDRQPRAHLVVGAIAKPDAPVGGDELTEAQVVLIRLVNEQKPAGDYAATLVRDTGRPEVYLAFDDEDDARKFASVVKDKATGSYPGWASQRAFQLDGAKLTALAASLPRQGYVQRNRRQMNHSYQVAFDAGHGSSGLGMTIE